MVDPNHSFWLSTSHLTTLRLHMILTKTSTKRLECTRVYFVFSGKANLTVSKFNFLNDAILFRDVLPVLQCDWIAYSYQPSRILLEYPAKTPLIPLSYPSLAPQIPTFWIALTTRPAQSSAASYAIAIPQMT